MRRSILDDAFAHHIWATLHLLDACIALTPDQLASAPKGTYGSVIDTLRHLVAADAGYLAVVSGEGAPRLEADGMTVADLRAAMERTGGAWARLLREDLDPERVIVRRREDGSETHAPLGVRLAQALHHGTDHRSQVCTALTSLGIEPPTIDVWDFGREDGRVVEVPAAR